MAKESEIQAGRNYELVEIAKQSVYVYEGRAVLSELKSLHGFSVTVKLGSISSKDRQQCMAAIDNAFKKLSLFGYHDSCIQL